MINKPLLAVIVWLVAVLASRAAPVAPLTLKLQSQWPHASLTDGRAVFMATIQAPAMPLDLKRAPVNLVLVLDRSGSMLQTVDTEITKMDRVKKTVNRILDIVEPDDHFAIVSFNQDVQDVVEWSAGGPEARTKAKESVQAIGPDGWTNIGGGLLRGMQLAEAGGPDTNCAVLLLTDGHTNYGEFQRTDAIVSQMRALYPKRQCQVFTYGFGADHNSDMLKQIAEAGSGNYQFIARDSDVAEAFGLTLGGMFSVYAKDVMVRFEPLDGTAILRPIPDDAPVKRDGAALIFSLATLMAEKTQYMLVELALPNTDRDIDAANVLHVSLKWRSAFADQEPGNGTSVIGTVDRAGGNYPRDNLVLIMSNPDVDRELFRFLAAKALSVARDHGSQGRFDEARAELKAALAKVQASRISDEPFVKALIKDLERALEGIQTQRSWDSFGHGFVTTASYTYTTGTAGTGLEASPTNGQLLVGCTGATPVQASITQSLRDP